jgi:PIN domain nuclease of toxin-antitoxin system
MTYLLDTHYMLWTLADTKKLSARVKEVITNPDHRIAVSAVSFWEVALKSSIGKLEIEGFSPDNLPQACIAVGFEIENLTAGDCSTYHQLKATYHKDPFDRMLIWQAIRNNYTLISVDANVKKYTSEGLQVFTDRK